MSKPIAISYGRFSSPSQAAGASRTRQQDERALAWCAEHGFELDSKLFDEKFSGYDGENRLKGALGGFLKKIGDLKVPPGSALIIEALDRLSREEALEALSLITAILTAGVEIVTLEDGLRYSRETLRKQSHLIYILIGKIQAAHDYSERLSGRVYDGKTKSRTANLADGLAVTRMCPAWLKVVDKRYVEIADRVAVVKQIFAWLAADVSKLQVTHRLNERGIAPFDREGQGLTVRRPVSKNGWHTSYVGKLVRNRALIGEFHPTAKSVATGKHPQATGAAPTMLYPVVIDPALFERVNVMRAPAGRRGRTFSNVLTKLARCALCDAPMSYKTKAASRSYLICDAANRRVTRNGVRICLDRSFIRYADIERDMVLVATEVARQEFDTPDLGEAARATSKALLRTKIAQTKVKIVSAVDVQSKMSTQSETVADMITGFEAQITTYKAEITALERQDRAAQARRSTGEGRELIALHDAAKAENDPAKRYAMRARIAGILGRCLSYIQIEASSSTITVWANGQFKPKEPDYVLLVATRHVDYHPGDEPLVTLNPAYVGAMEVPVSKDIVALARAEGRVLPDLLVRTGER